MKMQSNNVKTTEPPADSEVTNCREEELARANIYALLAALFADVPKKETLDIIEQMKIKNNFFMQLQLSSSQFNLSALNDEYHVLFIGFGRGELLPYASWYLTGFLMEKSLLDLRKDMQILGFQRQANYSEPEDHISGIFEMMRMILTDSTVDFSTQKDFFDKHIYSWVMRFFADLSKADNAKFYKNVATFGSWFINLEKDYLELSY